MTQRCLRCSAAIAVDANYCARCGAQTSARVPADSGDPRIGRVVLGRYRVLRKLGEGGMGEVYLAEQAMGTASRPVALKTLRQELMGDPKVSGRFLRESEIVIRLAHPNTIQFYDFGQLDDGTLAIVMEYIEGRTLADELRSGPLPLARVDALMTQICGSLAEAHAHGIVHRDLKPQNVLLTRRAGRDDFVKIVDFGIALRCGDEEHAPTRLTAHGTLIGTPPYMSPEQFQDREVDARSDVYSLGVMLYEMLTGSLPFDAKSPWEWAAAHLGQAPKPIAEQPGGETLPPERARCVMRALEKDPARRPRDAGELLQAWAGAPAALETRAAPGPLAATAQADAASDPEVFVAPTLRAPLPARARPLRSSWVPVFALVAVGAVITWRGGASSPDTPADGEHEARIGAGRARPKAKRRHQAGAATQRGDGPQRPGSASHAGPIAAGRADAGAISSTAPVGTKADASFELAAAHEALEAGDALGAARALQRAQAASPPTDELAELRAELGRVIANSAKAIGAAPDSCARLGELSAAARAAQLTLAQPLSSALGACEGPPNSPMDAGPNFTDEQ